MSRFTHVKGNTFYISGAVNIGVVKANNPMKSIIIDTGLDDDSGKRILKELNQNQMGAGSVINTHSHADHCGGNNYVQTKGGAKIYASAVEKALIENPELEPFCLFSAKPLKELDVKFLRAKPSRVDGILEAGAVQLEDTRLEILPLSGHMCGMIGAATEDSVAFLGDAVFPENIIEKYKIIFMIDVKNVLNTLEYIKTLKYDYYIPSHGTMMADPLSAVKANIKAVMDTAALIYDICSLPMDREQITAAVIEKCKISLSIPQYYLTLATVSAYLSYMSSENLLAVVFEENKLKWKKFDTL